MIEKNLATNSNVTSKMRVHTQYFFLPICCYHPSIVTKEDDLFQAFNLIIMWSPWLFPKLVPVPHLPSLINHPSCPLLPLLLLCQCLISHHGNKTHHVRCTDGKIKFDLFSQLRNHSWKKKICSFIYTKAVVFFILFFSKINFNQLQ